MEKVLEVLITQWLYDVQILSQPWVLWLVVPAMLYCGFMLFKWTMLTCPVWLPIVIVTSALNRSGDASGCSCNKRKSECTDD